MSKAKTRPCERCGRPVTKKRRTPAGWLCMPCAAQNTLDAVDQLRNRKGPIYDRWRAAAAAAADAYARGVLGSAP